MGQYAAIKSTLINRIFIKSCMFQSQDAKIPIGRRIFFLQLQDFSSFICRSFLSNFRCFFFFHFRSQTIKLNSKNFQPLLPNDHCTFFLFFFFFQLSANEYFIFESWKIALKLRKKFLRKIIRTISILYGFIGNAYILTVKINEISISSP